MFLLDLMRYFRGSVRLRIEGDFAPRFVNLAARERVSLWDCRKEGQAYTAGANAAEYKRLRVLAKKAGVRIRLVEKSGVPFSRRRYRRRWGLPLGLAIFTAFLFAMSLFLWRIDVNGLESIPVSRVLSALEELGVAPGSFRGGIDVRDCERRVLMKVPELAWVAINIDGSVATIETSERDLPPVILDARSPCNVVAAKSGQIVAMNTFEGQAMVRVGEAVLEGDILISGITQDKLGKNLFRHARGEVTARLEHTIKLEIPLDRTRYVETGEIKRRDYLDLFGITLPLFLPIKIDGFYHVERAAEPLSLFGAQLPATRYSQRYIMMEEEAYRMTEPEAKDFALKELHAVEAVELAGAEILERRAQASLTGGSYHLQANYVCIMEIGVQKEILVSENE